MFPIFHKGVSYSPLFSTELDTERVLVYKKVKLLHLMTRRPSPSLLDVGELILALGVFTEVKFHHLTDLVFEIDRQNHMIPSRR